MLEFEVHAKVNEEQARGKRIWNSAWLDAQKRPGPVRSRLVVSQVRGASKREDVFAATAPLAAMRFTLSRAASRGHGRCLGLWDVSVAFFHAAIEEEVFCSTAKEHAKGQDHLETLESHVRDTGCKFMLAEVWCEKHCVMVTGKFSHAYRACHIQ